MSCRRFILYSSGGIFSFLLLDLSFVVRQAFPGGIGGFRILTSGWGTGSSPLGNSNIWMAPFVWGVNSNTIKNGIFYYKPHKDTMLLLLK